jgi:ABC-type branched-subunit amino acid transport system substrate-binding protein
LGVAGSALVMRGRAHAAEKLRVGMTSALTGPASTLGLGMKAGIETAFARVNTTGGLHGRQIELIALDDGYEPGRAAPNMRKLIDVERVFAVLGNAGTPTAAVTVPIANEKKIPLIGAFTGAGLLRKNPPDRYVINYRASYAQETAEMIRGLVSELRIAPARIAFFTQNDAYGDSGHAGGVKALQALGYAEAKWLPHGRYPRNTVDVEEGLARLIDPRLHPQAVIMVGAYRPCAKFIRLARKDGLRAIFVNVSFVVGEALAKEAGPAGDGVVVAQVVPHYEAHLAATRDYCAAVPAVERSFISLEGFLVGRAFIEGMKAAGPDADQERFISTLEKGMPIDLGLGVTHHLSPQVHQLSDRVWPTVIRGGKLLPLGSWRELGRTA